MERKKASVFPQELLNLFDEYMHGRMSRRDFLDGVQKFAVVGLTAAVQLEMLGPERNIERGTDHADHVQLGVDATSAFGTFETRTPTALENAANRGRPGVSGVWSK